MFARYVLLAVTFFCLHGIWETMHVHLYTAYDALGAGVPLLLWATSGDVLYSLLCVLVVAVFFRDFRWPAHPRLSHLAAASLCGFWVAVIIEWKALIFHKWAYTAAMPMIPLLHVGLSPVLQMSLAVPLCVLGSVYVYKQFRNV